MPAPLPTSTPPATLPAMHLARPASNPNSTLEGRAARCPICGQPITVDSAFVARECGHAVLRTSAGVLVASRNIESTRARLSAWAYGHTARVRPVAAAERVIEGTVKPNAEIWTEVVQE
jgi:hypothetical protein